jgi:hypothetical protein
MISSVQMVKILNVQNVCAEIFTRSKEDAQNAEVQWFQKADALIVRDADIARVNRRINNEIRRHHRFRL